MNKACYFTYYFNKFIHRHYIDLMGLFTEVGQIISRGDWDWQQQIEQRNTLVE